VEGGITLYYFVISQLLALINETLYSL